MLPKALKRLPKVQYIVQSGHTVPLFEGGKPVPGFESSGIKIDQSWPLFFFIFVFATVNSKHVQYKVLPMAGFEPQISGTRSVRSTATAAAQVQ